MHSCTEQVDPEWIKATVVAVDAQHRGEAVWLLSLSSQPSELKHMMGDNCGLQVQPLTPKDLYEAQQGDNATITVIQFKISGKPPTVKAKWRASPKVQSLLREWKKRMVGEDGILRRRSGSTLQLVLLQKFHRSNYRELHEEMGHLGVERVLHLARERFFWPHMKRDIEHYVTGVCSCLKQRRPNIQELQWKTSIRVRPLN